MARPTKAKDPKPKADSDTNAAGSIPGGFVGFIVMNGALTIVICAIFVAATYMMMNGMINKLVPEEEAHASGHGTLEANMSFPYDLDDFIINLNSPNERRYLKVKIALDIERHEDEPAIGEPPAPSGGGHGGHGGGGEVDPKAHYTAIMEPFKMPIRDIIITKLSSMSAEELSSVPGKEQAKDRIKEEINTIMPEDRQVFRVNFGEFIIQ
jgi:flagellar basal body-associated protein FliL